MENKDIKTCLILLHDDNHKWNSYCDHLFQDFSVNENNEIEAENGLFIMKFEVIRDFEYGDYGATNSYYEYPVYVDKRKAKWYECWPYLWYLISQFFLKGYFNFLDLFRPIWCVSEEAEYVGHYITDDLYLPHALYILALGKKSESYKIYHWFLSGAKLKLYKDVYRINIKRKQAWQQS